MERPTGREMAPIPPEQPSVDDLIAWTKEAISGELEGDPNKMTEGKATGRTLPGGFGYGDLMLLDFNDRERYTMLEHRRMLEFIEEQLGTTVERTPILNTLTYPDGSTVYDVLDKPFGPTDNPWYLTRWKRMPTDDEPTPNESDEWYVLRSQEMIEIDEMSWMGEMEEADENAPESPDSSE